MISYYSASALAVLAFGSNSRRHVARVNRAVASGNLVPAARVLGERGGPLFSVAEAARFKLSRKDAVPLSAALLKRAKEAVRRYERRYGRLDQVGK